MCTERLTQIVDKRFELAAEVVQLRQRTYGIAKPRERLGIPQIDAGLGFAVVGWCSSGQV